MSNNSNENSISKIIANEYKCCPEYLDYYLWELKLDDQTIRDAIKNLENKTIFSTDLADDALYRTRKQKHSLCIVVPTYNRPSRVKVWLAESMKTYYQYGVDVLFVDSSEDDETKNIIKNSNFKNVFYETFDDNTKTIKDTIDEKVCYCFKIAAYKYDAIWPCHDVAMPDMKNIYEIFERSFYAKEDLLIVDAFYNPDSLSYLEEYNNSHKMILDLYGIMTSLSSVIYFSKLARKISDEYPVKKGINDGLWVPTVIFHAIANNDFKATYIITHSFNSIPDNGASFWLKNKSVLKLYAERWPNIVKNLPVEYDSIRENILYNSFKEINFNDGFLLYCRVYGNFGFIDVLKNFNLFRKMMKKQFILLFILSLLPPSFAKTYLDKPRRWNVKLVREIIRFINRLEKKFKCKK